MGPMLLERATCPNLQSLLLHTYRYFLCLSAIITDRVRGIR